MPVSPESPDERPNLVPHDQVFEFPDLPSIQQEFDELDEAERLAFEEHDIELYNEMVTARAVAITGGGAIAVGAFFSWSSRQEWVSTLIDTGGFILQAIGGLTLVGGAVGASVIQLQRKRRKPQLPNT